MAVVVGGKAIASWVPFTILGFEVMVLIGGLATVFRDVRLRGHPRLTTTVGYDARFSGGISVSGSRPIQIARRRDEHPQEARSRGGSS
jgi:hypothetical protein